MVLGLWETCLCAKIDTPSCKWAGASVFGRNSCDRVITAIAFSWASTGLLFLGLLHYIYVTSIDLLVWVYAPVAFISAIITVSIFALDVDIWHHAHSKGDMIGRGFYFAVFATMLQSALVVALIFAKFVPPKTKGDYNLLRDK